MDFGPLWENASLFWHGMLVTIYAMLGGGTVAILLGGLLGILQALGNRYVSAVVGAYVYFFRGTPALVLLFLTYFGLPQVGISFSPLVAGMIALGLCSAAYIVEVVRASMSAVDQAQHEAAEIDGARKWWAVTSIVFPQALPSMVAPATNELINLTKGTSLLAVISVADMTRAAQLVVGRAFVPFEAYIVLAGLYLVLVSLLTVASHAIERYVKKRTLTSRAPRAESPADALVQESPMGASPAMLPVLDADMPGLANSQVPTKEER